MDLGLGCMVDMGCIDKNIKETSPLGSNELNKSDPATEKASSSSASRISKNKSPKGTGQSALNALNKFTSQIRKPSHRKGSPVNWFPRKKVDSYLKRKIRMLQETDGMKSLDETLGDTNPHYSRVLREKIAAKEAAHKAMEARKAALVEASWCRILKAASIQSKDAELVLQKAEKTSAEAFEAASAMGVIMYDKPNCNSRTYKIETSTINDGASTTHTVTASFETAFDVDKKVAAAVKAAFIRLANCDAFHKDEFKELLWRISQNPDMGDSSLDFSEISSECESELESELGTVSENERVLPVREKSSRKDRRRQSLEKLDMEKLMNMMLERIKCLNDEELSSLATIVATSGLNAALAEVGNSEVPNMTRRMSSFGAGTMRHTNLEHLEPGLPSLDKFLVKHMTRLEREVLEAKNRSKNESNEANQQKTDGDNHGRIISSNNNAGDLGSILVKHSCKIEKEFNEAKMKSEKNAEFGSPPFPLTHQRKQVAQDVPSLDKFLVKHMSRLEREVQEARKNGRKSNSTTEEDNVNKIDSSTNSTNDGKVVVEGKENVNLNKVNIAKSDMEAQNYAAENSLDKILIKPVHRLEREKTEALAAGGYYTRDNRKQQNLNVLNTTDCESLDKILVKPVSRLEKEKMKVRVGGDSKEEGEQVNVVVRRRNTSIGEEEGGGLDKILVKHKSRLEREKMAFSYEQPPALVQKKISISRREAREKELREAWGGLSLGCSIKPHLSKLERDKAAWIKAEEEERRRALEEI